MQGSFLLPIPVSLPRCDLWDILAHLETSAEPGRFMALGNSSSRAIYLSEARGDTGHLPPFVLLVPCFCTEGKTDQSWDWDGAHLPH